MRIRWYGHAAFLLAAPDGKAVFLDPFGVPGPEMAARGIAFAYPPIRDVRADLVLVTHEHFDHNAADAVAGGPQVIRARAGTFDTPIGKVTGIVGDHDAQAGTRRGMNAIYAFALDGMRVCHFGDYGQARLRDEQEAAIGTVDVLLVPVGGGPTVEAEAALELVRRLRPRYVVPMHYRTPAISFLDTADAFLDRLDRVVRLDAPAFETAELPGGAAGETIAVVPTPPA